MSAFDEDVAPQLDIQNENGFVHYFKKMPECGAEIVRVFNRGDFYTVHGDAAEMVACKFLNTSQALKNIGTESNRLSSVAISKQRYESFLRFLLIENNYRVEIYCKRNNNKRTENDWLLETEASPGRLGNLEEILSNVNVPSSLNQNVSAFILDSDVVSFASISVTDCTIYLGSFRDNASFTALESLIVRLNPKECLIQEKMSKDRIKNMLKRNHILFSEYPRGKDSLDSFESILSKLVKEEYKPAFSRILGGNNRKALIPFNSLLSYLCLLNDPFCYSNYHLKEIELGNFVRLDLSSISNLHLFPKKNDKALHSLYKVLNFCKSPSGRKLLDTIIRQPLTNLAEIEQRLDNVEFFRDNLIVTNSFYDTFLPKIPDITKIYKKFTNGRCKLMDIFQVYLILEQLPLMQNTFEPEGLPSSVRATIYDKLDELINELDPLKELVEKYIDFDHFEEFRELSIRGDVNEELNTLKNEMSDIKQKANRIFKDVCKDLGKYFEVDMNTTKMEIDKYGFYFRMTKKYLPKIPKKNYNNYGSGNKDARFKNDAIDSINEDYVEISHKYEELQQQYIDELIAEARQYMESILQLENVLAYIDVMISFSMASKERTFNEYCRPKLLPKGTGRIVLKQFRHPIIEILKEGGFIANDVILDKSQFKIYVITGPNMGGKSTFIRSVALCVLMAQIGCFVPCTEAEISIVDAIYTRISANDDPTLGLSTFMSEMVEASAIIRSATADSLIVIDELGRSTGTFDGFGIAEGITDHLANSTKAYALFATHFHSLAEGNSKVGRLSMKASIVDGKFVNHYEAEPGTAEKSFGIELAKRADMPARIVENAQQKLEQLQKSLGDTALFERVIAKLKTSIRTDPAFQENNDRKTHKEFIKEQIKQKLLECDWSEF